ncbi:MAG: hypothetical protein KGZ63_14660 [Clostridiales bacterium]|jgi:hypothetical protein|nr:hypothetical protein [Clostridiales bacterium]
MLSLLKKLQEIGYRVTLDGECLRLLWTGSGKPDPATINPLLSELRMRKSEAVSFIRNQSTTLPSHSSIKAAMDDRGYITIYSEKISQTIYLCRDQEIALSLLDGSIAFTLRELQHLVMQEYTPDELRELCDVKKELLRQMRRWKLPELAERLFNGILVDRDTPTVDCIVRLACKKVNTT